MEVLEVLWQIGIMVEDKESLKILEKNGAKINYELKGLSAQRACKTYAGHHERILWIL